jgi:endo-1,4-beta-xylanase
MPRRRLARNLLIAAAAVFVAGAVLARKFLGIGRTLPDVPFLDRNTDAPPKARYQTFHSSIINGDASYLIYLPPDYEKSDKRYPVIYWLHGLESSPRAGESFIDALDAAIASGDAPPAIAVFVNGLRYSRYYDSKDGKMPVESVFIKDLIPHIDATYRTIATRQGRAIEGFSMGGFGAIRFGFKYPELFCAATSLSGAFRGKQAIRGGIGGDESWSWAHFQKIFGGDVDYYWDTSPQTLAEKNRDLIRDNVRVRFFGGALDGQTRATVRMTELLDQLKIPYQFTRVPGVGHQERKLYEALGPDYFHFYRDVFTAPSQTPPHAAGE